MLEYVLQMLEGPICVVSETDKHSSQLGKYPNFFIQLGIGLFNWVSLCLIPGAFQVIGYFLKVNDLVNNLRFHNFLCMSASIFVFITLMVSTQTRHLNTWWPRHWFKLQCVSLSLAYFNAGSWLFFDIVYNQPQKLFCPFLERALVYTTTGMSRWFLCTFK